MTERKKMFFLELMVLVVFGLGGSLWGQPRGFAYVANFGSDNVSAYTINAPRER